MARRGIEVRLRIEYDPAHINPTDQRGVLHYTLVDPLPRVCVEHGRTAIDTYQAAVQFDDTQRFAEQAAAQTDAD